MSLRTRSTTHGSRNPHLAELARSYDAFRTVAGVGAIRSEADHRRALALIEAILDETRDTPAREDASHPLADLLDLLTAAVHEYEADHYAIPVSSPREVLRFLMDQHGLTQSDLPEVGSQSVISEILAGRRTFNTRQIAALVQRFHVAADAFIEHDAALAIAPARKFRSLDLKGIPRYSPPGPVATIRRTSASRLTRKQTYPCSTETP